MTNSIFLNKIVNLSDARRRLLAQDEDVNRQDEEEHRREFRRASSERLFAQVIQANDQSMVGTTLSCHAIDVSPNGLKVSSDEQVPVGCVLDLWVDDSKKPGKFFLSSDVRWVTEQDDGTGYQFGVQLHNGAATDIEAWRQRQHG
jgi:hypothetical protein